MGGQTSKTASCDSTAHADEAAAGMLGERVLPAGMEAVPDEPEKVSKTKR